MKTPQEIARCVESAIYAATAAWQDVEKLCAAARKQQFHSVCVSGSQVEVARAVLEESNVQIVALVAFPLGLSDPDVKRYEAEVAVDNGAHEIDFVANLGRLKAGDRNFVLREMRDIVEAADERPVKVVIETSLLTREEKILVCELALDSGVQFVATSADFHAPAVTVEAVKLLSEKLGDQVGVKAAGDVRDWKTAASLLEAGAKRIGTTAGAALMAGS
jgi:deoxyribose-phosphate aldolase